MKVNYLIIHNINLDMDKQFMQKSMQEFCWSWSIEGKFNLWKHSDNGSDLWLIRHKRHINERLHNLGNVEEINLLEEIPQEDWELILALYRLCKEKEGLRIFLIPKNFD